MSTKIKHIILGVTGSIAAYKSADLVRRLQEQNYRVSVIMTRSAEEFITPLTLASLSGQPVYRDLFDKGQADWQMPHISLAREADALLIAPATANIIAKMAHGIADDLLTCLFLATRAPVIVAPAMNDGMYHHKIVEANCQKLKDLGVTFVNPVEGQLACGTCGEGHLADTEVIVKSVQSAVH